MLVAATTEPFHLAQTLGRKPSHPLGDIAEKGDPSGLAPGMKGFPRLQNTGFIVGCHHAHHSGLLCLKVGFHPRYVDFPSGRHRDPSTTIPEPMPSGIQTTGVFNGRNPDGFLRVQGLAQVIPNGVVGFAGATGPDHIQRSASEDAGQLLTSIFQRLVGSRADAVQTGRVPGKLQGSVHPHLSGHRAHGCGGVVVKVMQQTH